MVPVDEYQLAIALIEAPGRSGRGDEPVRPCARSERDHRGILSPLGEIKLRIYVFFGAFGALFRHAQHQLRPPGFSAISSHRSGLSTVDYWGGRRSGMAL